MSQQRIVMTDHDFEDMRAEQAVLEAAGIELVVAQCRDEQGLLQAGAEADGLLVQYARITGSLLDRLPRCRVVVRYGIGVDTVDLAAAGLDVLECEPLAPRDPLLSLPNVLVTPHAAFYSRESYDELHRRVAESAVDVLRGRAPPSVVNRAVLTRVALGGAR